MSSTTIEKISPGTKEGLIINLAVCGILGFIFNAPIITVLIKKIRKGNAHGDTWLCSFIALTDITVSIGLIFRSILAEFPYNNLQVHQNWCKFDLLTTTQLLIFSGYSLGVMSIERFLLICFNIKLQIGFWFLLIWLTWTPQFIIAIILAIQGNQILTRTEVSCSTSLVGPGYYGFLLATVLFVLSFSSLNLNVPKDKVYAELRSTLTKSIVNILLYVSVFSTKTYIIIYEAAGYKRTLTMDIVSQLLISYSPSVNSLILLYMNQEVRNDFFALLKNIKSKMIR
ncbi:hypothetical protein CONCODRAFT_2438 [Conidiobolus coronatus NRRL 28638]|uniref:Family A G protein-coupled receptor-like protein n=1 Tax=Conidiobolus coronatus (strain ATCC 28846 / CBS 209.66 / NRRL 28638) TaxID=796925 RepID=A0A137PHH2_CONC2|nr:hypothetical protein CONCODRAFT_2438 [Conidiobolus coronatus NRRL 28638]|eukprot:KXN74430.1 hypothetical protein CONCODRAFT_2438 [Conidiobolus coronatus NRRL 28638]